MATFNLKNDLSKGITSTNWMANNFNYSDTKLLTRIRKTEEDVIALTQRVTTLEATVARLVNLTNTHSSQIASLQNSVSNNANAISSLRSSVNSSISSLSSKISNTNSSVNSLSSRISSLSSRISSLESSRMATFNLRGRSSDEDIMLIDDLEENIGGEEELDDSQKLDYIMLAIDTLTLTTRELVLFSEASIENIDNINNNIKVISKSINEINKSIVDINNKLKSGNIEEPEEPPVNPEEPPIEPEEPPVEPPEPEEEIISITTKNNIIKTRSGKVIYYPITIEGLVSNNIAVYINGNYSHSIGNVVTDDEITVFSEIIYQEMDNHMVEVMIEAESGARSNTLQFLVDVVSIFETEDLVLSANKTAIFCAQHEEVKFPVIINGSLDGYCNLYVNGVYAGFIQGFENGEEFVIFKQKVYTNQEFILQIEYPEGNRSNELVFTVFVDQYVDPGKENEFYIYSDEVSLTARSGETVSYIASIRGIKSNTIKIYVNGSYIKTLYIDKTTDLEDVILYEEDVTTNKIIHIQLEDNIGNYTNILSYEVTLINNNNFDGEQPSERDLVINWDDLERYVDVFDQVVCKANISGLTEDWCNVYINGYQTRTLSNLTSLDAVVLHEFIAEEDAELNIQIENSNGLKSNVLKYCIHIKENIVDPEPTDEKVLGAPDSNCVEYSKLIGGNRSSWTRGNQELISDISRLGINSLILSIRMLIPDHTSNEVTVDTDDLELVKAFMLTMRSQGLLNKIQVIFEPCPCINNGEINEREFNPSDKESFIITWSNEIIKVLNEFKDYSFWGILVNTNMDILYDKPLLWQRLYDEIKEGRPESNVMIKTNWWESDADGDMMGLNTKCTADYFKIWDIIAISAYFPLSNVAPSASYSDIYKWINYGNHNGQKIKNDIRALSTTLNKPIMFGELGIPAVDYAVTEPSNPTVGYAADETTQKNWYSAWHDSFIDEEWFLGWYFYHMSDLYESAYDPTNKSAGLYIASLDILNKYKK